MIESEVLSRDAETRLLAGSNGADSSDEMETVVALTPDQVARAADIIALADQKISVLAQGTGDYEATKTLVHEIKVARAGLLAVVTEAHGGNQQKAVESDFFEADFKRMTAAVEPPKKSSGRGFPGVTPKKQGER